MLRLCDGSARHLARLLQEQQQHLERQPAAAAVGVVASGGVVEVLVLSAPGVCKRVTSLYVVAACRKEESGSTPATNRTVASQKNGLNVTC